MPEPDMSVWTGRVDGADGPQAQRWHQMVKPLTVDALPGVALIGFACDEGVRRNQGRIGAKEGPQAIRSTLANLAWHQTHPVYDAGNIACDNADLEGAQAQLAKAVEAAVSAGHRPLILGGGHETAWGTFQGIVAARLNVSVGVINLDAHFDLRSEQQPNSGTPFSQIANWCQTNARDFRYMCLGVAAAANTAALFERARNLDAVWRLDSELDPWSFHELAPELERFAERVECVYLSIDLDVLPASTMPAVSSPAGRGVSLEVVSAIIGWIVQRIKVAAVDIVELNPNFDVDGRGARVAARLAWQIATEWIGEERNE